MSNLKYKCIVIFGPQGSGKGTQAEVLREKFGILHLATGEIFRNEIAKGSELGRRAEVIINDGNLMPDGITNQLMRERLRQPNCETGFVLDGYPRNLTQAEFLDGVKKIDLALEIWISDDEAVMRIGGRRICPECGTVYHLKFKPPKNEAVCDIDGEGLVIRDDDKEEAVRARLLIYHEQTEPLIEFYRGQGVYRKIDGMPSIPEVTEQIMDVVIQ